VEALILNTPRHHGSAFRSESVEVDDSPLHIGAISSQFRFAARVKAQSGAQLQRQAFELRHVPTGAHVAIVVKESSRGMPLRDQEAARLGPRPRNNSLRVMREVWTFAEQPGRDLDRHWIGDLLRKGAVPRRR
jgi:hypothetical protein